MVRTASTIACRFAALPELGQGQRDVDPVPLAQAAQDPEPRVPGLDQGPDHVADRRRVELTQGVGHPGGFPWAYTPLISSSSLIFTRMVSPLQMVSNRFHSPMGFSEPSVRFLCRPPPFRVAVRHAAIVPSELHRSSDFDAGMRLINNSCFMSTALAQDARASHMAVTG
jgi:hypothetical protein